MRDLVIHLLSVKGYAAATILTEALRCDEADATAELAALEAAGLITQSRIGARLTDDGKARADAELAAQRAAGDAAGLEGFYASFEGMNTAYKAALAAWQLREGPDGPVPNDHSDDAYDAQVRERMFASHDRLLEELDALAETWPLLGLYARRLETARARVDAGEMRYVAAPLIDSYHTVWFELHEALIRMSGRTRAAEAAAGRAL